MVVLLLCHVFPAVCAYILDCGCEMPRRLVRCDKTRRNADTYVLYNTVYNRQSDVDNACALAGRDVCRDSRTGAFGTIFAGGGMDSVVAE